MPASTGFSADLENDTLAGVRKRVPAGHIVPSPQEKAELLRLGSEFGHQVAPLLDVLTLPTNRLAGAEYLRERVKEGLEKQTGPNH